MITLITGTPGAGKTLYTVAEELPRFAERPLYVDGIPDLAITHQEFPAPLDEWHNWAPDGAVLVVDEAQRTWRPRGTGAAVPPAIAALETHRHKGLDFVVITQHPNLIDQNVRRLVGRHIHIRRVFGWGRAMIYEWDQATDPTRVRTAITRGWSYPRKVYKFYKSATVHTARGQRAPWVLWAAIAAAVALPVAIWNSYDRIHARFTGQAEPSTRQTEAPGGPPSAPAPPDPLGPTSTWDQTAFWPRVTAYPESAPAYDHLRKVVAMPVVSGCVSSAKKCVCYTDQGTRVDVGESECRSRVDQPRFDPYREAVIARVAARQEAVPDHPAEPSPRDAGEEVSLPGPVDPLAIGGYFPG